MKNLLKGLSLSVSLGCLLSSASASQVTPISQMEEDKINQGSGGSVNLSLAALPEELQLHIAAYLANTKSGRDVGNFSLTCSRLHAIGEEIMQKRFFKNLRP